MLTRITNLNISKYFLISCLASIIDLTLASYLYNKMDINYLIACNLGIAAGFLFQYFTSMKYVFNAERLIRSFVIYFATFVLGLLLASGTMWISYNILKLTFLISKLMSMAVPFFITYFIRKIVLGVQREGCVKYENLL